MGYTRGGFRGVGDIHGVFWDIHFWLTNAEIFLKAPLAPIYTNFKGGARAEKDVFWSKFSKKA